LKDFSSDPAEKKVVYAEFLLTCRKTKAGDILGFLAVIGMMRARATQEER
jgi:hypothetical protein